LVACQGSVSQLNHMTVNGRTALLLPLGAVAVLVTNAASAQSIEVPATWGGDLSSRPRLTGDWGGVRDKLGKKGVVFDLDLLLTPQDVVSGGRSTGSALWGNVDYTLNVDTQKLGLWRGGFLKVQGDTGFGNNVLRDSGALVPVNTAALIPGINKHTTALMNATVMQFLTDAFALVVGKINTLETGYTEFYGDLHTQFLNAAFVFPMTTEQIPLSAWGGGIIALPTKDLTLSALALNPNGTPTTNPIFGPGVELVGSAQLSVKPFDLVGHQGVGFSWNDKVRYSLEQDPANIARLLLVEQFPRLANPGPVLTEILEQYFPGLLVPTVPPDTRNGSWAFSYTFDQYLWQPAKRPQAGIGVFFAYGISDGNPNPIRYSFLAGFGGKGVVPGRVDDTFGFGFASTQFSSEFLPFLREHLDLGLEHENAFEMYYNAAITGWLALGADLQVVSAGLTRALTGTQLTSVDTAVIVGLRARVRF